MSHIMYTGETMTIMYIQQEEQVKSFGFLKLQG